MRRTAPLVLLGLLACDGDRAVDSDGADVPRDGGGSCSCATPLAGTLAGNNVRFDQTYYGVDVTWGSHANPASPEQATGLNLLPATDPLVCLGSRKIDTDDAGPLMFLKLETGSWQSPIVFNWNTPSGTVQTEGEVCLETIPVQPGDAVGYPPQVFGTVTGCARLDFTTLSTDKALGQAAGRFVASRCTDLDSAWGE